jgi:hypothetical protein
MAVRGSLGPHARVQVELNAQVALTRSFDGSDRKVTLAFFNFDEGAPQTHERPSPRSSCQTP